VQSEKCEVQNGKTSSGEAANELVALTRQTTLSRPVRAREIIDCAGRRRPGGRLQSRIIVPLDGADWLYILRFALFTSHFALL
jgi:hypothetical protein